MIYLPQEAQFVPVSLGLLDEAVAGLPLGTHEVAKLGDGLRVEGDGLAADLWGVCVCVCVCV